MALLVLLGGAAVTVWCGWCQWQRREGDATGQAVRAVGGLTGLALIVVGMARYRYGWEIIAGPPLLSLGTVSVPTWTVLVPVEGLQLPQQILLLCGWAVIPGVLWLVFVLFQSGNWLRTIAPIVTLAVGAGLVRWSMLLVNAPDDWFWPDAGWARVWRILVVFGALGVLMAAIGWFIRSAREATEERASAPLLLVGVSAVMWLIGKTPLGEMVVPAPMIFLIVLGILASVFLNQTIYGRYLLALGRNEEAARYSGINTLAMIVVAYLLCSLAAGIGGILFALDLNSIQPSGHGNFYELYAIAAAVLGGCSLRGGEGTILGVVIGAAVMQVLRNSISMVGIPSKVEFAIIGLVILLGVIADEVMKRNAARRKAIADSAASA
jgi:ABC-type xylose transport system permease subunit